VEPFESLGKVSYSHSIVTIAIFCIALDIQRDIGRKLRFLIVPLHSTPQLGGPCWNIAMQFGVEKTRMVWLPDV